MIRPNPGVGAARREVLEDLMDVEKAREVLRWIETGKVKAVKTRTPMVSPFGLILITQSHTDFITGEERAQFLKRMHALQIGIIGKRGGS